MLFLRFKVHPSIVAVFLFIFDKSSMLCRKNGYGTSSNSPLISGSVAGLGILDNGSIVQ